MESEAKVKSKRLGGSTNKKTRQDSEASETWSQVKGPVSWRVNKLNKAGTFLSRRHIQIPSLNKLQRSVELWPLEKDFLIN